jgi:hypothetical protein
MRVGAVIAALGLAGVSLRWVEAPFRRRRGATRHVPPRRAPALAALAAGAAAVLAGALGLRAAPHPSGTLERLVPPLSSIRSDRPRIYDEGCHLGYRETRVDACVYGAPQAARTVFLVGDSHAAQWFPALDPAAARQGWRLRSLTKSRCPFAAVDVAEVERGLRYVACKTWRDAVLARIRAEAPELVVISNGRAPSLIDASGAPLPFAQRRQVWVDGLAAMVRTVRGAARRVVVVADVPRPRFDVPVCLERHGRDPAACSIRLATAVDPRWLQAERAAVTAAGGEYADPTAWVCPEPECQPTRNDVLVYRDDNHLTTVFVAGLERQLRAALAL